MCRSVRSGSRANPTGIGSLYRTGGRHDYLMERRSYAGQKFTRRLSVLTAVAWFIAAAGCAQANRTTGTTGVAGYVQPATASLKFGEPLRLNPYLNLGVASLNVLGWSYPVPSPDAVRVPRPGDEWLVAHIQVCAGPVGIHGALASFSSALEVWRANGDHEGSGGFDVEQPAFLFQTVATGDCFRGYVSFEIPIGDTPTKVAYFNYSWHPA